MYKWRAKRASTREERAAVWSWGGRRFGQLVANGIDPECDTVYAFSSAALEMFERAREMGIRSCLDCATAPLHIEMALRLEEAERFEGWSLYEKHHVDIEEYRERQRCELQIADVVVCGSSFARRLIEAEGASPDRTRTVPLAISSNVRTSESHVKVGRCLRVLFVGGDGLRKGIGYLAQAIDRIDSLSVEVRVAGDLELSEVGLRVLSQRLSLLGPIPRNKLAAQYQWADVLVLPSVSDTFGLVILEAMAAGVPVITTPNTGGPDVIREGLDGFIVPIRDADAIAEKLEYLATDHAAVEAMSRNAVERSREFSIGNYGKRLVAAATSVQ